MPDRTRDSQQTEGRQPAAPLGCAPLDSHDFHPMTDDEIAQATAYLDETRALAQAIERQATAGRIGVALEDSHRLPDAPDGTERHAVTVLLDSVAPPPLLALPRPALDQLTRHCPELLPLLAALLDLHEAAQRIPCPMDSEHLAVAAQLGRCQAEHEALFDLAHTMYDLPTIRLSTTGERS